MRLPDHLQKAPVVSAVLIETADPARLQERLSAVRDRYLDSEVEVLVVSERAWGDLSGLEPYCTTIREVRVPAGTRASDARALGAAAANGDILLLID
jgi:hypothetical protein